jgi:hypothetical protein
MKTYERSFSFLDADRKKVSVECSIMMRNGGAEFSASGDYAGELGQVIGNVKPANEAQAKFIELWRTWHLNGLNAGTIEQQALLNTKEFDDFKNELAELVKDAKVLENICTSSFESFCETIGIKQPGQQKWTAPVHIKTHYQELKFWWEKGIGKKFNDEYIKLIQKHLPDVKYNSGVHPKLVLRMSSSLYEQQKAFLEKNGMLVVPHPVTGKPYTYGSGWILRELPQDFEQQLEETIDEVLLQEDERKGKSFEEMTDEELCAAIREQTHYDDDRDVELCAALVRMFDLSEDDLGDVLIDGTRVTVQGIDYMAGTDEEMDELWDESLDNYLEECVLPELPEMARKYFDNEAWKRDARHDGRGHCLNSYDGTEEEQKINNTWYYAYRQ